MRVVVGEHVLKVRYLDVAAVDFDVWGDEDEVNLLALERRDLAELVPGVGRARVVGRHVVNIK